MITKRTTLVILTFLLLALLPVSAQDAPPPINLTLVGYAVPREAYGEIIPLFKAFWKKEKNQDVNVLESWAASGAQSRAVAGGFEADVVAFSLEPDITRLVDAGLITHDWKDNEYGGIVSDSLVIFAVRPGNPLGIEDWDDLANQSLEIITPDPKTSGGAQWNILGGWGSTLRGNTEGFEANQDSATEFLRGLITNISVLDRDGRESFLTFERGIGDVAITYENEAYAGLLTGAELEIVYPKSTILIENPVALVDTYVDAHGTREVSEAFINFLYTPEAQRIFAANGFRPVNEEVATELNVNVAPEADATPAPEGEVVISFPPVEDQFTIADLGGWGEARPLLFGDEGIFTQLIAEIKG
jgi:sulfate transport system substrate-binding protein